MEGVREKGDWEEGQEKAKQCAGDADDGIQCSNTTRFSVTRLATIDSPATREWILEICSPSSQRPDSRDGNRDHDTGRMGRKQHQLFK